MQTTALEALTAELLGDIGIVHDQIKALRVQAPAICQAIETTGIQVSQTAKESIDSAIKELKDAAKREMAAAAAYDNSSKITQEQITKKISEATDAGIAKMKIDFYRVGQVVLEQVRTEARNSNPNILWLRAKVATSNMMAIAVGILVGVMGLSMYLDKKQQLPTPTSKEEALGRAIMSAWPHMDKAAKNVVLHILEDKTPTRSK
ncbi:hypothetical protein SAMN04515620_17214 [Collimonas sp. OK607]|uniref:hypothetical protein n=1 Tax=Collimonas sp. OK607 TaxID=1798194 RepID=UPI0008E8E88D|nr:hypothetical protein [Collimonas sp. OK607]SFB41273.1 hypothetical protein SAMN04515620_17214 [Collimonas sp. OK607]